MMKKSPKSKKSKRNISVDKQKKDRDAPQDLKSRRDSRTTLKDQIFDDVEKKKSVKVYSSRCSPTIFKDVMEELKSIIGQQQMIRIKDTPFGNWIDMTELAISSRRIDFILNRFDINSCSLIVGDDIKICFTPTEFSIILGLRNIGQPVDLDLKMESTFLARQFGGQVGKAKRAAINEKLISLACSDDALEVDDFVRLYILFIFNCIIFSTGNYYTPSFIFPYLDDLTTLFDYAWGDAVFRYLYRAIRNSGSKTYLDGCTVGLMAWVYERVPSLAVQRCLQMFPRFFRWSDSKIPLNDVKAESLLKSIDSTKILSIYPFEEEKKLLQLEEDIFDARMIEKFVSKKLVEIKKRMCVEMRLGEKEKMVDDKDVLEFGADAELMSKNEFGFVNKMDENIEKNENEIDVDLSHVKVNDIVSKLLIGKTEIVGGNLLENDIVFGMEKENIVVRTDELFNESFDVGVVENSANLYLQDNVDEKKKESNELVRTHSGKGSFDMNDKGSDIDMLLLNVVNEIEKENNDVVGSENNSKTSDNNKSGSREYENQNSDVLGSEKVIAIQSSIVDTVRARVYRKKKRKSSMFVTPPSSTPRPKRKEKKRDKSIVCIDENSKSPMEDDLHEFNGRHDYCGHEEATEEERKLLANYLSRDHLNVVIWQSKSLILQGRKFCEFLFGEPVDFEIINVYMRIMQQESKEYGFEIYCKDTTVQREIFERLKKNGSRRKLQSDKDYASFIASLISATRGRLQELNKELFTRCKYIIFPMNARWHWFLVVYKTSEGVFKIFNSLKDPFAFGIAKNFVSFLAGCMRVQSNFVLDSVAMVKEQCRDQGATLECSVYTCMWIECLARDTDEIWAHQRDVNMTGYRVRVAATILSDVNGLLKTI